MTLLAVGLGFNACKKNQNPAGPGGTEASIQTVTTAEEAKVIIDNHADDPDFIIMDVRTQGEFDGGHIAGAVNQDLNDGGFITHINALDKNKTYLVYCRSGNRSTAAVSIMEENGFRTLINFSGGINEWTGAGYSLVTY